MSKMMRKNHQQHFARRSTQGFSMVELLVVLGIVGLATAVLLPAVQTVRRTASTTQCADNLRTLGQALTGYANDHQYYPYSYYKAGLDTLGIPSLPDRSQSADSVDMYVWWSVIRSYVSGNATQQNNGPGASDEIPFPRTNAIFNCPDAVDRVNGVDYVPNAGVLVYRSIELGLNGHAINKLRVTSLGRPTSVYSDTALLWDAPEVTNTNAPPGIRKNQYALSVAIDAAPGSGKMGLTSLGLVASPRKPSWRYRNVSSSNRTSDPKNFAEHTPIYTGINADLTSTNINETAGGIRFRHGANNRANFLFADGSVRTHGMTLNWDTTPTGTLLRKYFRSKLPPGHSSIDAPS